MVRARLRFLLSARVPGVVDVLRLMGPRVFGLAVVQINFYVNIRFASAMADGSVVAIRYAFMLCFLVLGMIGQSQASAVFPPSLLSGQRATTTDSRIVSRGPCAMCSICLFPPRRSSSSWGEPLVSILQRGAWTAESTQAVAWALSFYAIGIAGFALLEVLSRAFYALEDTRTPVIAGTCAMLGNIVLNFMFIQFIGDPDSLARGAFAGLALANALTTIVEALALWWLLRRRLAAIGATVRFHDRAILVSAGGSLFLSLVVAAALSLLKNAMPTGSLYAQSAVSSSVGRYFSASVFSSTSVRRARFYYRCTAAL